MSAKIRFSLSGFITPAEGEALKNAAREMIRSIEAGEAIQKEYNLPDIPTASLISLAWRNGYKYMLETIERQSNGAAKPGTDTGEPVSGSGSTP